MISATGGVLIGLSEVILLPLDALKIKGQTGVAFISSSSAASFTSNTPPPSTSSLSFNHSKFYSTVSSSTQPSVSISSSTASHNIPSKLPKTPALSAIQILSHPKFLPNLYVGATWTAARNMTGCFALFGASSFVKDRFFTPTSSSSSSSSSLSRTHDPLKKSVVTYTLTQHLIASTVGACASIAVAAPLDVIKVRVQASPLDQPLSGWTVLKHLVRNEGMWALTKGIVPKMMASAPKVTFSFTIATAITERLGK